MISGILLICLITCVSDLTPGPNFWKIVHYTLGGSRRRGVVFIFGLSLASMLHCLLGLLGVSALMASTPSVLVFIQIFGGGYIIWFGVKMILTRKKAAVDVSAVPASDASTTAPSTPAVRYKRIFVDGVLTNFSNPKTILFYASLFAMTLTPHNSVAYNATVMVCLLLTSLLTNLFVASVFSFRPVIVFFGKWERGICRMIGGLLILGGLKVALQSRG